MPRDAASSPPAGLAGALAMFMTPAAFGSTCLALWRLGADLGLTHPFAFSDGPFSHWQVWFCSAAALAVSALLLNRRADTAAA